VITLGTKNCAVVEEIINELSGSQPEEIMPLISAFILGRDPEPFPFISLSAPL
jgi:hypothetical protein